ELLPFAVPGRIAGVVREDLHAEGRARRRVEAARDRGAAGKEDGVQDGEVLPAVRAGIAVAGVVGRDAAAATVEVDPDAAVRVDVVRRDALHAGAAVGFDRVAAVEGDEIALDERGVAEVDTERGVAERTRTRRVAADQVALDRRVVDRAAAHA